MKTRSGFVSNSSSTSFLCVACGFEHEYIGDVDPSEVGMVQCRNGHEFHRECLPGGTLINIDEEDIPDHFSVDFCPACNFEIIPEWYVTRYIFKNIDKQTYINEIKIRFHSIEELEAYLKEE